MYLRLRKRVDCRAVFVPHRMIGRAAVRGQVNRHQRAHEYLRLMVVSNDCFGEIVPSLPACDPALIYQLHARKRLKDGFPALMAASSQPHFFHSVKLAPPYRFPEKTYVSGDW